MIHLAYDGSIHGAWVARYALRLAAHDPEKRLAVIHVREDSQADEQAQDDLTRISAECEQLGVDASVHRFASDEDIFEKLMEIVPPGPESYVVCGTRFRHPRRGYLSGGVAARLLDAHKFHVLAIRVVQPGLLGAPHDFLLPVAGHPRGFMGGLPFLRLLRPDIATIHLLHVKRVTRWRFRWLSAESSQQLRQWGNTYCHRVEQELENALGLRPSILDANVVISDDVPREIVVYANKLKSQLILLGASERSLSERLFYGNPIERVLRDAPCDVAIYRAVR
jgi:nucleotide-binding universal stress UspA family protein